MDTGPSGAHHVSCNYSKLKLRDCEHDRRRLQAATVMDRQTLLSGHHAIAAIVLGPVKPLIGDS